MNDSIREQLLGRIPLLAALPDSEIQNLAASLRPCAFPAGALLFHEGKAEDHFYILLEGRVEILKALDTPDERLLGVRDPVEFIGEMSLFNRDGRHTASVRAVTPLQMLEMARADFDALLHRQPALAYDVVRTLSTRLHASEDLTIRDLQCKNRQLAEAYEQLQAAQAQLVEKEKLERELAIARAIQESILPPALPHVPGFDFGARLLPARAVGGDFYDLIPLGGDRLGIVVGDVSDKGVPAALFMALTYSLVRAEAARAGSPCEALLTVNRHLLNMNTAGMFVTILYGVLNYATCEFHYARAGHPPPLVLDGRGQAVAIGRSRGQPLGPFAHPELDEQCLRLPVGGTALLYTDGVTEAVDAAEDLFGLERIHAVLSASQEVSAQATCDRVWNALEAFSGPVARHDDVTLVCIKVVGA
ncbi:MAG: SpoIIE family protein phosphatase [Chloroflexi bacterium]|nr:SpoIIE family protein phosphatase [Chloroflexota bacterium]